MKKRELKNIFNIWKTVFSNWRYIFFVFLFTLFFYIFNVFITNIRNILYSYKNYPFSEFLFFTSNLIIGFRKTILPSSFASIIVIGFLTGILISLLFYNFNLIKKKSARVGFVSGLGLFLGIIAPGCAACGIGLIGLLGLTTSLASLPFQGREIGLLAIILISFSVVKISNNLANQKECDINNIKIKDRIKNSA